jgi:hypothetical protein
MFEPGLETYFALKAAADVGAKQIFGGREFNVETIEALRLEADMYPFTTIWNARKFFRPQSVWASDYSNIV